MFVGYINYLIAFIKSSFKTKYSSLSDSFIDYLEGTSWKSSDEFLDQSSDDDSYISPTDSSYFVINFSYDETNSSYGSSDDDSSKHTSYIITVFSYDTSNDDVSNNSSCNSVDDFEFFFLVFYSSFRRSSSYLIYPENQHPFLYIFQEF